MLSQALGGRRKMKEYKRGERPERERYETAGRGGRAQPSSKGGEELGRKEE